MLCILSWLLLSYSTMHYSIYNCHVRFSYALNGLHFPNPVLTSYFTCHSIFDNQGINNTFKLELKNDLKEISKLQRVEDELYLLISLYEFL